MSASGKWDENIHYPIVEKLKAEIAAKDAEIEGLQTYKIQWERRVQQVDEQYKEIAALRAELAALNLSLQREREEARKYKPYYEFPDTAYEQLKKERDELKGCCGCNATKQAICPEHLRLISQLRQMREALEEIKGQHDDCESDFQHRVFNIAKKALGQGQHGQ